MIPSMLRVVRAARRLIADAQANPSAPSTVAKLAMASSMLNDLALASDANFYGSFVAAGQALIKEGARLEQTHGVPDNAAGVASLKASAVDPADSLRVAAQAVEQVSAGLIGIVQTLFARAEVAARDDVREYYGRVTRWETSLYQQRQQYASTVRPNVLPVLDTVTVESYLHRHHPQYSGYSVLRCGQLSGGYSRSTWLVECRTPAGEPFDFVVRGEQPVTGTPVPGFEITTEFGIVQMGYRAGIPMAEPLWLESDKSRLGMRFLASRRAQGVNIGSFAGPDRELSQDLLRDLLQQLVAIHRIDYRGHPTLVETTHLRDWMRCRTVTEAVTYWLDLWEESWKSGPADSPVLARAFTWLRTNIPAVNGAPALLHSDYALGNLLIQDDRISAVLDWEATHTGDPAEEVSWLIGNLAKTTPRETILELYRVAGGDAIADFRLRYFDVFAAAKLMMCGIYALRQFDRYDTANPNQHWLSMLIMESPATSLERLIEVAESSRAAK